MRLYDKHRPADLDSVVGQPKAVAVVRGILARGGFGGRAVWVSGASGTGKTTIARIIARTIADGYHITEYDSGADFGAAELAQVRESMQYHGFGKGGRAFIINEAHTLRAPIIASLLGLLEALPEHCVFIFTTTKAGEDKLFEDQLDSGPLMSRCLKLALTNQGLAEAFAERALMIARSEGLDGQPLEAYIKLMRKCKNNLRAALCEIESGCMAAAAE